MINNTRLTFFSPYDNVENPLINFLSQAKTKIRLGDYSFNDPAVVDTLIELQSKGLDISLVLDKSQSEGSTEEPQVERVKQAGVPLAIGTSDEHKIIHVKFVVIDDEIVVSGSYNFTVAAEAEDNFIDIEYDTDRAQEFTTMWQKMHDFIVTNEPTGIFNQD